MTNLDLEFRILFGIEILDLRFIIFNKWENSVIYYVIRLTTE